MDATPRGADRPRTPVEAGCLNPGGELTDDEVEFGLAMHAYQLRYRRRYPAWSEVLYVLRTLGYAKQVKAENKQAADDRG